MNKKGFTLIEIAMVLVVIGILLGIGTKMMGVLTKRTKLIDAREVVKQAKEALSGYAVKNGFLPATIAPTGARELDAWQRPLVYALPVSLSGTGNACGLTTTDRTIYECTNATCSTSNTKPNIAFIVYSTGEDADGLGTTTKPTAAPACPAGTCYWIREQATSDASYTLEYDDIVQYVTLDEIRAGMGCTGVTTTIPNSPTVVTATRATLSSLNLTWTPPTTNTDTSLIIDLVGYEIDRSLDGVTYSLLQSIGIGSSFSDTPLVKGQRYFYQVRALDKDGNKSANSLPITSTTISPIKQTGVKAAFTAPANNAVCLTTNTVPNCTGVGLIRSKTLFSILNNGNAADNGANITINSMVVTWTGGGTSEIRKIQSPDITTPNRYCIAGATGLTTGTTITLTSPIVINAGAPSTTLSIYWCGSVAVNATNNVSVQFNTSDGNFALY